MLEEGILSKIFCKKLGKSVKLKETKVKGCHEKWLHTYTPSPTKHRDNTIDIVFEMCIC